MRFLLCGLLLLTATVLANAGVGRSVDEDSTHQKVRLFKRSPSAEGRGLSQLFSLKGGGCSQPETQTEVIESPVTYISGSSSSSDIPTDYSHSSSGGVIARGFVDNEDDDNADELDNYMNNNNIADDDDDDDDDDNGNDDDLIAYNGRRGDSTNRPMRTVNRELQDYELRRQEETNKLLRQRIQQLQRRNKQNIRRAQRARKQQRRRNRNSRRRANLRNQQNRRRADARNRVARRRLRRNNNRRNVF